MITSLEEADRLSGRLAPAPLVDCVERGRRAELGDLAGGTEPQASKSGVVVVGLFAAIALWIYYGKGGE